MEGREGGKKGKERENNRFTQKEKQVLNTKENKNLKRPKCDKLGKVNIELSSGQFILNDYLLFHYVLLNYDIVTNMHWSLTQWKNACLSHLTGNEWDSCI